MLKKIIALLLALALTAGLLAGCGTPQEPVALSPEELWDLAYNEWLDVTKDYLLDMVTRWGYPEEEFLEDSSIQLIDNRYPYIRRDGKAVIAELTLQYQPNEAMLADGLWWGETPRWEGDWCIARRQILINCIDGEWQYGGSATDGLNTEDFREFTEAERAACPPYLLAPREPYLLAPREQDPYGRLEYYGVTLRAGERTPADVTVTDLQVIDAAPDRFTGRTLEDSPREVTVELPGNRYVMIPRRGDQVRVVSGPLEESDRIPSDMLIVVLELLPSDLAAQ